MNIFTDFNSMRKKLNKIILINSINNNTTQSLNRSEISANWTKLMQYLNNLNKQSMDQALLQTNTHLNTSTSTKDTL